MAISDCASTAIKAASDPEIQFLFKGFAMTSKSAMAFVLALVSTFAVSSPSQASEVTGRVIQVYADSAGGQYNLVMASDRTGRPACASDTMWAIANTGSDGAKAVLSIALTAYALGRPLRVVGTGSCPPESPTREAVAYVGAQ